MRMNGSTRAALITVTLVAVLCGSAPPAARGADFIRAFAGPKVSFFGIEYLIEAIAEEIRLVRWLEMGESDNQDISFFGKVVDEEGVPLEGVEVVLKVHYFDSRRALDNGELQSKRAHEITTDSEGLFSITHLRGYSVHVAGVAKEGYRLLPAPELSFYYRPNRQGVHLADPSDPVVFSMWRNRGAEGVVRYNRRGRIPYDGTEVHFDLEKGRLGGGTPDLRISLLRDPSEVEQVNPRFDWILRVEVPDGGLVPITGIPTWEAPEDGYVPSYDLVRLVDSPGWKERDEVTFFVKARGGDLYARIRIDVLAGYDQPTTAIMFEGYVNRKGSRILEPK